MKKQSNAERTQNILHLFTPRLCWSIHATPRGRTRPLRLPPEHLLLPTGVSLAQAAKNSSPVFPSCHSASLPRLGWAPRSTDGAPLPCPCQRQCGEWEPNLPCSHSPWEGGTRRPGIQDACATVMTCCILPDPYGGKLTLWQIYEDV